MDSGGFYALASPDNETHEMAVEIMPARREHQFRSMPYLLCWTAESKVNCDENH